MSEFEHKKIKQKFPDLKIVKAVIFDFDETLYSGGDWSRFYDIYSDFLKIQGFPGKTGKEVFENLKNLYPEIKDFGMRVCNYAKENGYDVNILFNYLNENIYDISSEYLEFMDYSYLKELSKFLPIYLISNSPENYIKHYSEKFGIDLKLFKRVYFNKHEGEDFSKTFYMKKCFEDAKISPNEALVVGDDLFSDIHFGKLVGAQTYYVTHVSETEKLIKKIIKCKKNDKN